MAHIDIHELTYTYPHAARPVLKDVSLSVQRGEYVALVGANGSGKSTLLRCLNGIITPPAGSVCVAGADPSTNHGIYAARRALSLVFQSPAEQLVSSIVDEDVAFGLENMAVPRPEMERRVAEALDKTGLAAERRKDTRLLSAGQQQRLALAGAIAMRPEILAFDEATSMLDPQGRTDILRLMDELSAEGITLLHVTHDMDELARAKRAVLLSEGRIHFDGTPAELFALPNLSDFSLNVPRAYAMAVSLGLQPVIGESARELGLRAVKTACAPVSPHADDACVAEAAFELRDVSMRYGAEGQLVLKHISLSIPKGRVTALVGVTGSGKSSLLHVLAALALPCEGSVLSLGSDTADRQTDVRRLRMKTPLAIQRPESAVFERYAGDEVAFGPRNQGIRGAELVDRVRDAMDAIGLPYSVYRDTVCRTLSGGQKRRLALASVLALQSEALLLDEPTSSLDPRSRDDIVSLIFNRARERGVTVVAATHSMEEAAEADYVLVLQNGLKAAFDTPQRVFGELWDEAWGMERPFLYELAAAMKDSV